MHPLATTGSLADRLVVHQVDPGHYRGQCVPGKMPRAFGGHMAALALLAAGDDLGPERRPSCLQVNFIAAAQPDDDVDFLVTPVADSNSFSVRTVLAQQSGKTCLAAIVTFHRYEESEEFSARPGQFTPAPAGALDAAEPDELPYRAGIAWWSERQGPVDRRFATWYRIPGEYPRDQLRQAAAIAYLSDIGMASTVQPDGIPPSERFGASLDHTLWFHRDVSVTEPFLFACEAVTYARARGMARGEIFDPAGRLVVSTAQQVVVRRRRRPEPEGPARV